MLPEFIKTKQKIAERQHAFFKWAVDQHLPPQFKSIPTRVMHEGGIIKSKYSDEISYEKPVERIGTNFTISTNEILENPDIVFEKLWESAPDFANQQTVNMIEAISTATSAIGNNYQIQDLTPESFLMMLERLEIAFNNDGTPRLPQIMAGTVMREKFVRMKSAWEANSENSDRFGAIIDKKRTQWHDKQAARKLAE
ncbi:MAG: hypothetical protein P0Y53_12755 [Candidatus Pseudobacter hemicellulosilyticus]|uniref:Uncharacterized protein n=1 Tax=Candidatus Pseudobacter hemicellulosilyticus TaxID=3121375 RepID=A0AAJ5WY47_9BACT|nr:MAG: hypothetical protein P0Y53_12755 [Pseudobacter sp.]